MCEQAHCRKDIVSSPLAAGCAEHYSVPCLTCCCGQGGCKLRGGCVQVVAHQSPALPFQAADEGVVCAAQGGMKGNVWAQSVAACPCSAMASGADEGANVTQQADAKRGSKLGFH